MPLLLLLQLWLWVHSSYILYLHLPLYKRNFLTKSPDDAPQFRIENVWKLRLFSRRRQDFQPSWYLSLGMPIFAISRDTIYMEMLIDYIMVLYIQCVLTLHLYNLLVESIRNCVSPQCVLDFCSGHYRVAGLLFFECISHLLTINHQQFPLTLIKSHLQRTAQCHLFLREMAYPSGKSW